MAESSRNVFNDHMQHHEENFSFSSAYSLIREAFYSLPHQNTDAAMRNALANRVAAKFFDEVRLLNSYDLTRVFELLNNNIASDFHS